MDSRVRAYPEQLSALLEFMERHGDLSTPPPGLQGRLRLDQLWLELTDILNKVGGDVSKTTEKWKKVWSDWKSKTKKKRLTIRNRARANVNGSASQLTLTPKEKRVLAVMGALVVEPPASAEELGFDKPQPTAPSQAAPPVIEYVDATNYLEIIDESPWVPSSTETNPILSAQEQQTAASPPAPAPAPSSTSASHRPRLKKPVRHQASSSASRQRLRARRRPAIDYFERVARHYTALQLRRLKLEEVRLNQQHERDMQALQVERERTQVFSSLVNAAHACVELIRRRVTSEQLDTE